MAWQLVYTSAPTLLDAGRTGFGTVARHEAIRPALQTELERISQFSREQGLSKDRILFYHHILDQRGESYHVISRIKDAGADYTGRTNHIAHHIVLSATEATQCFQITRCTPVDMILWATSNGLWRDQWAESARLFNASEEINTSSILPRCGLPAATWGSLTGAPANGAILAPGGQATEGCWILYREKQSAQVLSLIGESLCLNPTPWGISFSTNTQPTDRIEEIQWRGVVLGSPMEKTARHSVRPALDLGNPGSLPPPVAASASLAETGLNKATEPISKSGSETKDFQTIKNSVLKELTPDPSVGKETLKPTNRPTITGMMGGEKRTKRSPITLIAFSGLAVLLVAIVLYIWVNCVVDMSEVGKSGNIRNATGTIIKTLTRGDGLAPNDDWWENLVKGLGTTYKIVPVGFKTDFIDARTRIDELSNQKDPDRLFAEIKRSKNAQPSEPLKSIIDKIITIKTEFTDQENENAKMLAEKKKEVAKKIAQEEDDKRKKEEAALESQAEIDRLNKKAVEKVQQEADKKILNISLVIKRPNEKGDPITHKMFYAVSGDNTVGWSWKTNALATNIQQLIGDCYKSEWNTRTPLITEDFDNAVTNNGFCFLKKDDSPEKVTITIVSSGEPFTNIVLSQPVIIEKNGDKLECKLSPEISPIMNLFTNEPYLITYEISKPKYTGESLGSLSEKINQNIKNLNENILAAKTELDHSHSIQPLKAEIKPTNPIFDSLDKAGEILSQGLEFKSDAPIPKGGFPEELKTFTAWLSNKKLTEKNIENFNQYLSAVFNKILTCRHKITYSFISTWINQNHSAYDLFADITKNRITLTPTENSGKTHNDESFKTNVSSYFTPENEKNLKAFLTPPPKPSPTPNYEQKIKNTQNNLSSFINSLEKPPSLITIKDANSKPILIFTAP
jgi:hypothetical protein